MPQYLTIYLRAQSLLLDCGLCGLKFKKVELLDQLYVVYVSFQSDGNEHVCILVAVNAWHPEVFVFCQ